MKTSRGRCGQQVTIPRDIRFCHRNHFRVRLLMNEWTNPKVHSCQTRALLAFKCHAQPFFSESFTWRILHPTVSKNKDKTYQTGYRLSDFPKVAQMIGASLQILPLHLSKSHLCHVLPLLWRLLLTTSLIIFKSTLSIPLILTLYSCTASYTFISGSPGKGDAVSSSYNSPQCWAHSKCSASEEGDHILPSFP